MNPSCSLWVWGNRALKVGPQGVEYFATACATTAGYVSWSHAPFAIYFSLSRGRCDRQPYRDTDTALRLREYLSTRDCHKLALSAVQYANACCAVPLVSWAGKPFEETSPPVRMILLLTAHIAVERYLAAFPLLCVSCLRGTSSPATDDGADFADTAFTDVRIQNAGIAEP